MNSEELELLHDYREDVLDSSNYNRSPKKQNAVKKERDNWDKAKNILAKTLVYELAAPSICGHVESYDFVKKNAFNKYCEKYKEEYKTSDIMNGWWFCFKRIFNVTNGRFHKDTIELKNKILDKIRQINDEDLIQLYKELEVNPIELKVFLGYLRIAYTIGNLTPAPVNPGGRYLGEIDFWEYKLFRYKCLYHDYEGDIYKLKFEDYSEIIKEQYTYKDYMRSFNLENYMNERIELILKRGWRIINKEKIDEKNLIELKKNIIL